MDNQHKKIKGYRDLQEYEVHLMNQIKERGQDLEELIAKLHSARASQLSAFKHPTRPPKEVDGLTLEQIEESGRCITRAEDSLKTGIMWLVRSVALPNSF
tara:strand:- start:49153 stop:49452 length:300 start_codon:yes stop_codon:yes gene_type:complete